MLSAHHLLLDDTGVSQMARLQEPDKGDIIIDIIVIIVKIVIIVIIGSLSWQISVYQ